MKFTNYALVLLPLIGASLAAEMKQLPQLHVSDDTVGSKQEGDMNAKACPPEAPQYCGSHGFCCGTDSIGCCANACCLPGSTHCGADGSCYGPA